MKKSFLSNTFSFQFLVFYFLIFLFSTLPDFLLAQQGGPGVEWTSGVDFQINGTSAEDTWAFNAVEMNNGDFVVVGYAETNNGQTRVPAFAVIDKFGALKHSSYRDYNLGGGAFAQVIKTQSGDCILAGWQGSKGLLVKLSQSNYSVSWAQPIEVSPNSSGGVPRIFSVQELTDGDLLCTGGFKGGSPDQGPTFFTILNNAGLPMANSTTVLEDLDGKIYDCKTVTDNGETYVLVTGFKAVCDQNWKYLIPQNTDGYNADDHLPTESSRLILDYDVLVGIFNVTQIGSGLSEANFKYFNSKRFDYTSFGEPPANAGPPSNINTQDIWDDPTCITQYGPCTPGKSDNAPGWGDDSENGAPVMDKLFGSKTSFVSKDVGRSIVHNTFNNLVYVSAEMNTLEMTAGYYKSMHRDGLNGVELRGLDCPDPVHRYGAYKDAYVHLLKFDLSGNFLGAENVAHASGGDFYASIVVDQNDGNIVLGTTTADRDICGLPPIDLCNKAEVHYLAKYDATTLENMWQQHFLADQEGLEGSCAFGLLQTSDGGFMILGNNEMENGDETFTIVKYTGDCQYQQGASGGFFHQNGDYTLANNEIWDPNTKQNPYRIRGNIIVPHGKTLTIKGGLEVQFAFSKNDFENKKSGITVKPGGKLYIKENAVLKGINCGSEQMWDGIIVEGIPTANAGALQGYIAINGAETRIENAVRGVVLGNAAWSGKSSQNAIGSAVGTIYSQVYNDNLGKGGGRMLTQGGKFKNCGKGIVWNPMSGPNGMPASNLSHLANTIFEFSSLLADETYKPSYQGPGSPIASELGCQIRSVKDITFNNVRFINSIADGEFASWKERPSGIYATDSKITIHKLNGTLAHYEKLYVGVESASMLGGVGTTASINAIFDRVYQGVNVRGNITPTIWGCDFKHIPDKIDTEDGDPAGVHSENTKGISLNTSLFDSNPDFENWGARIKNSLANAGATVEVNTFTDMNIANRFEQDNSNIKVRCNTYQGAVGEVSWDVKGLFANQRIPQNPNYYPDNKFTWDCNDPFLDIRSVPSFAYYERTESANNTNTILKCYSPVVSKVNGPSTSTATCIYTDPCPNPPLCNELFNQYLNSGMSLPYRNDLMNAYVRMLPSSVPDSLFQPGTTRAVTLLTNRNQQEDKQILVGTHLDLGNNSTALQLLQQVNGSTTEVMDFLLYYNVLANAALAGRNPYNLTQTEFSTLAPLMTHNSSVADQVKVIDHVLNGVYHPMEGEPNQQNRSENQDGQPESVTPDLNQVITAPNPFSNEVRFLAPVGTSIISIEIMDLTGKLEYSRIFENENSSVSWKPDGITSQIMVYRCGLSNGKYSTGKLMYVAAK
ncbi:MAG: hypothetical protein JNJ57_13510 [Saprospiraceae bacterium]|nr:hypothetical protein [Saprospiraceae bacterium]